MSTGWGFWRWALLAPQYCPTWFLQMVVLLGLQTALYTLQMENWHSESSKPDFVVTWLEPRTQDSIHCTSCRLLGLFLIPTTTTCITNCEHNPGEEPLGSRHWECGGSWGWGGSGDQSQVAPGPASTPITAASGRGMLGGCPRIHSTMKSTSDG